MSEDFDEMHGVPLQRSRMMVVFPTPPRGDDGMAYPSTDGWVIATCGEWLGQSLEGRHFDDQMLDDLPASAGIWVWEGSFGWTAGGYEYPDDCDPIYTTKAWRRATADELAQAAVGNNPFLVDGER